MDASRAPLRSCRKALLTIVAVLILAGTGSTEPPSAPARRPSRDLGTWKWTVNKNVAMTLRLKRQGGRMTGVLIANDGPEVEIDDGKIEDGILTFKVTNTVGKGEVTAEYAGILAGNVINGGMRVYFGARPKTLPGYMPWQAKRFKEN